MSMRIKEMAYACACACYAPCEVRWGEVLTNRVKPRNRRREATSAPRACACGVTSTSSNLRFRFGDMKSEINGAVALSVVKQQQAAAIKRKTREMRQGQLTYMGLIGPAPEEKNVCGATAAATPVARQKKDV